MPRWSRLRPTGFPWKAGGSTSCACWAASTPTCRGGRVRLLREVGRALAPAGAAVLDFCLDPAARRARTFPLVKAAAWVTGGHRAIEAGDVMLADVFLHRHRDADQLAGEVRDSGLVTDHVVIRGHRGWARLRRP